MKTLARLLLFALVAQAAAFAAPALAQTNTAVAVNKKDGKSVFKLAFSVKKVSGDVDASNTAVAYASCTDCKTVAAAIQVVLVSDPGDSFTPTNTAIAFNYQCTECETLAAAYQFVYGDGQELEFTKEGKQRLHDLKKQFQDLKNRDDLTLEQLAHEIALIAGEVAKVVDTEVEVKKAAEEAPTTTTAAAASAPSTSATSTPTTAATGATTASTAPTASTTTTATPPATTVPSTTPSSTTTTAAP
jgi:putative peptide zinc metalloprotease protein